MTVVRSVLLAAFLCALSIPALAGAELGPPIDGAMQFPAIQDPGGPDEFVWEVNLGSDQGLRQVDDQHAEVYYTDAEEVVAFRITAVAAHDAVGAAVPTTIAVTQPNLVTLTVHHRDGNPAAGGAPFDYPIVAGEGWQGGFQTHEVVFPPGEAAPLPPTCDVPDLTGRSLRASRRILHRAHCRLGLVRGERSPAARVLKQYRLAGMSLPAWTAVGVKVS